MDEIHKNVLQNQLTYLRENLVTLSVACHLYEVGILGVDDLSRVETEPLESSRAHLLTFRILPRRGPNAYSELIEALDKTGQGHVKSILQETETKVREKKTKKGK